MSYTKRINGMLNEISSADAYIDLLQTMISHLETVRADVQGYFDEYENYLIALRGADSHDIEECKEEIEELETISYNYWTEIVRLKELIADTKFFTEGEKTSKDCEQTLQSLEDQLEEAESQHSENYDQLESLEEKLESLKEESAYVINHWFVNNSLAEYLKAVGARVFESHGGFIWANTDGSMSQNIWLKRVIDHIDAKTKKI